MFRLVVTNLCLRRRIIFAVLYLLVNQLLVAVCLTGHHRRRRHIKRRFRHRLLLAQLLNSKLDEVNKRLDKLDSLEKKVNDIDVKVSKLWSDLDKRVTKNAENITYINNKTGATDIELENTKSNLAALQKQNDMLKETLNDMLSKSTFNNLIVGGIKELENETTEQTEAEFRNFLANDLEVPPERINEINLERTHRIGQRLVH